MVIGTAFLVTCILIISIWVIIELKRFKHKLFAIILITLILFSYFSFTAVIKGKNLDLQSISGVTKASKLYLSWLGSLFGNVKTITTNAIKMDWTSTNSSIIQVDFEG